MANGGIKDELHSPRIVVVDGKLRDKEDILPLLRIIAQMQEGERNILIVCSDIAGDALQYVIMNHLKGFAKMAVARVPTHIKSQTEYLSDLAVSCGATVMSKNTGATYFEPLLEYFGSAKKVTIQPQETVIVEGQAIPEDMNTRIATLVDLKKTGKTPNARKFAEDRLANLEQKIVAIYVGGQSETDAEERHYRFEDAIGASKAALRGGIVPGGGTLLFCVGAGLFTRGDAGPILGHALRAPLFKVLDNAGVTTDELIIKVGRGIDVMHPEDGVIDLVERGIVDPAESEMECVKTAVAIAGLLMTTGAMVVDKGDPDVIKAEQ
jgi:chaperonin GroEL